MENLDRVIEKVKKLLATADKQSNASENEVVTATLMAQKLMSKYDLSLAQVDTNISSKLEVEFKLATTEGYREFRKPLATIIASNFRCRVVLMESRDVCFIGTKVDAEIATSTFNYLYMFIVREGTKRYKASLKSNNASKDIFNSYAVGFICGLRQALDAQCKSLALIVPKEVDDELDALNTVPGSYESPTNLNLEVLTEGKYDGTTALNGKRIE